MKSMNFSILSQCLTGATHNQELVFKQVSIDTRTLKSGDVFVAIKGPNFDGHDFIQAAETAGASGLVVHQEVQSRLPCLRVPDTTIALGEIAAFWRQQFSLPVVGITGSCGKTTVKSILAHLLSQKGKVLAPQASFNNQFGVALTLLKLTDEHQFAVMEMGANHPGEIAELAKIVAPQFSVVTTVAPVHLEGFKSIEGVMRGKREIYQALPEDGVAFVNVDNPYCRQMMDSISQRTVTFGLSKNAEVRAAHIERIEGVGSRFRLQTADTDISVTLPLLGEHHVGNALAALAIAYELGLPWEQGAKAIADIQPVEGRLLTKVGIGGAKIIDDSYNANPAAVKAAIEILAQEKHKKILVFGDMGELGECAVDEHIRVGQLASEKKIDTLLTVGTLAQHATQSFGANAGHFETIEALIENLKLKMQSNVTVLVKGSRSAGLERVVNAIVEQGA